MSEIAVSNIKTVGEAFGAVAGTYDASRRRLVTCFDDFYAAATRFATLDLPANAKVLDLGAGTGLLSLLIAGVRPDATFTLVDVAQPMLDQADRELTARGIAHRTVLRDLTDELPEGEYDAIVSALAIHHLDDAGKRDLYARAANALADGGVFVNAEQVAGPTPRLDALYDELWEADARENGSDDAEVAGARARMAFDQTAPTEDQLTWLREAGLADVACVYQNLRFAVLTGRYQR
ncbi:class I SAM-dependent methyltransferase [Tenggerimyces flavus]|uniref:Class I SAM-dependent methyltransferase n=1 Tax=Tenggerimyces flavus TaxID=1708749 RepID=A0ABV7Y5M8_9ACTN|nr:class I SAM-dependent methyltransferase [Tenggerimyces flavus]MBM7790790.1 tRNA (cmo5U34)-methyltransferase [Tenggerimyces flavus]